MTTMEEARERALGYAAGFEDASGVKTVPAPGSPRGTDYGWMDFAESFARAQDAYNRGGLSMMTNCKAAYQCWTESGGRSVFEARLMPSPELIRAARGWVADCGWADLADGDVADLSDVQIVAGVNRHYAGGWAAFVAAERA